MGSSAQPCPASSGEGTATPLVTQASCDGAGDEAEGASNAARAAFKRGTCAASLRDKLSNRSISETSGVRKSPRLEWLRLPSDSAASRLASSTCAMYTSAKSQSSAASIASSCAVPTAETAHAATPDPMAAVSAVAPNKETGPRHAAVMALWPARTLPCNCWSVRLKVETSSTVANSKLHAGAASVDMAIDSCSLHTATEGRTRAQHLS
mmetsp:Transcript_42018/g.116001  ORF Transcript_42018/g.116001 Transcript_42018/m.116001 type:complete len:209 (+) Transcript_42018:508-1134(+)